MKKLSTIISMCLILFPVFANAEGKKVDSGKTVPAIEVAIPVDTSGDSQISLEGNGPPKTEASKPFTVAQQQFFTPGPVTPAPDQPHLVRWSTPAMRISQLSREHIPPALEQAVDIQEPTEEFQFSDRLVQKNFKVNKLTPLKFTPFEILDPATGQPIPPDRVLTIDILPHRPTMTAQQYYDELNKLELGFNQLGYTLDVRRDPRVGLEKSIKLQEIVLDAPIRTRMKQQENLIKNTHRIKDIAAPKSMDVLQMEFRQGLQQDRVRLEQLKQYWQQQSFVPPDYMAPQQQFRPQQQYTPQQHRLQQQNKLQGRSFKEWVFPTAYAAPGNTYHEYTKVYETPKYEYGYRDLFAIFFNGSAALTGNGNGSNIYTEAEAGGYLFNNRVRVLRITGNLSGSVTAASSSADLNITVLSYTYKSGSDFAFGDLSAGSYGTWSKGLDKSFQTGFPLGPIFLSVKFGVRARVGIEYFLGASPAHIGANFGPFVGADVYAQAGIDIIIVEAGVRCTLTLLQNTLTLSGEINTMLTSSGQPYLEAVFSIYDKFEALSGHVDVYACIGIPCFDWPPWCKKCWAWEIASWRGLEAIGYILAPLCQKFYFLSGEFVACEEQPTGAGEGDEWKVEGDVFMTWYPANYSKTLPDSTSDSGPAFAIFDDNLHVVWRKNPFIYHKSFSSLVESGPVIYARTNKIPGATMSFNTPLAVCVFKDRLYVFHGGGLLPNGQPDQRVYYRYKDKDGNWWPQNGSVVVEHAITAFRPGVCVFKGALYLFYKPTDESKIYYRKVYRDIRNPTGDGSKLLSWEPGIWAVPGSSRTSAGPAACVFSDMLFVFYKGKNDQNIYERHMTRGGTWIPSERSHKVEGGKTVTTPAAIAYDDHIVLVYKGSEDRLWWQASTGWSVEMLKLTWNDRKSIPGDCTTDKSPAVSVFNDKICVFHRWPATSRKPKKIGYRWGEIQ